MNVHSHFNCKTQKLEIAKMSINKWMDKQIVVYPYNGIALSNRKELTCDTHNNMSGSQNNYSKWLYQSGSSREKEPIGYIDIDRVM